MDFLDKKMEKGIKGLRAIFIYHLKITDSTA